MVGTSAPADDWQQRRWSSSTASTASSPRSPRITTSPRSPVRTTQATSSSSMSSSPSSSPRSHSLSPRCTPCTVGGAIWEGRPVPSVHHTSKPKVDATIKMLLVGDSAVGKSCFLMRFADSHFAPSHMSTIGIDFKSRIMELRRCSKEKGEQAELMAAPVRDENVKVVKLQVWDTAGQEKFHTITRSYFRGAMAVMVVYDITCRKSFEGVTHWLGEVFNHCTVDDRTSAVVMLVGNKADLASSARCVTQEEGAQLAASHGLSFIETSAKTGAGVVEAFTMITVEAFAKFHAEIEAKRQAIVSIHQDGSRRRRLDCCS